VYNSMTVMAVVFVFMVGCGATGSGIEDDSGTNGNNSTTDGSVDGDVDGEVNNNNTNTGECGDGMINIGESCDDGEDNSDTRPDACRTDCTLAKCGDGVLDSTEFCDTNNLAGSSCSSRGYTKGTLVCANDCTFDVSGCSLCGDGNAEGTNAGTPEYAPCDTDDLRGQTCVSLGYTQGDLACSGSCNWDVSDCEGAAPVCGDGVVDAGEVCDDGNNTLTDGCPDGPGGSCLPATCGDGFLFIGNENCDTGADPYCHGGCQARCGDGVVDGIFGETCDDGNNVDDASCYADCSGLCGDGIVHDGVNAADHGEFCDDMGDTYDCDADCTVPICGDGHCNTSFGRESLANCPQDCDCTAVGGDPYSGGCCLPDGTANPPQGCEGTYPGCVTYTGMFGTTNCGACGNHCASNEMCVMGTCTT